MLKSGKFNFEKCRIPINNRLNIDYIRNCLEDYKDKQICDFLEFGFPIGFNGDNTLLKAFDSTKIWQFKNHTGAHEHPEEMQKYLQKEIINKAIIGPFKTCPFQSGIKISPLNSIPKKDTEERRVILDLSFPKGHAVNDFISKDDYLGEKIDLIYPKVDDFIQIIKSKGKGCLLFKKDLRRAFRQFPICPSSYNLVGFVWKKHIFCDTVLAMGCRSSAYLCQRVTNAISFIMFKIGVLVLNYLDDLASAEKEELAEFAYNTLGSVLRKCGIEESEDKSCPPSKIMTFVGVLFNTETMTIEITSERLQEIRILIITWLTKEKASLKDIQSLLGKLNFVAACVRPARLFVSRMLTWLKALYKSEIGQHLIPNYVKKDLLWWHKYLSQYNGVSMMILEEWSKPDEVFSSDSCLSGCGGFWQGNFFHAVFPKSVSDKKYNINILEILSVIICMKLWGSSFKGKRIQVYCDNSAVCSVINSGKAKCAILQDCLRELAFLSAIFECQIRTVYLNTKSNRIADHLSRWHLNDSHKQHFYGLTDTFELQEFIVTEKMFQFNNNW